MMTLVLAAIVSVAKATAGTIMVEEGDTTFIVSSYNDGRFRPYRIKYEDDGVISRYVFNEEGFVKVVVVGREVYKVIYDSDGILEKVINRSISRGTRDLKEEEMDDTEQMAQGATLRRRRLYDCVDCHDTWDVVCRNGHESVCDLEFLDTDRLTSTALESIDMFCDSFEIMCDVLSGGTACDGQCECTPALQISLEWFDAGDLDLVVTEPTGAVVSQANPSGVSNERSGKRQFKLKTLCLGARKRAYSVWEYGRRQKTLMRGRPTSTQRHHIWHRLVHGT